MAVRHTSEVTSGQSPVPSVHTGVNYRTVSYTLGETASASTTLVMAILPPGAIVRDAVLTVSSDNIGTSGGSLAVQSWTGAGNNLQTHIQTASANLTTITYNPTHAAHNYRHTASANVVVHVADLAVSTGTASTVFTLTVGYSATDDGD